ncbi:hypothetical protein, partial [Dyella subtropica]|uniref:hypothetical protein n=1 Tax=Dyella subtropica TaxID=2992127 RepID=UPI00225925CB
TLSKINHLRLFLQVAPKRFVPGEPPILHRLSISSTPAAKKFFSVLVVKNPCNEGVSSKGGES